MATIRVTKKLKEAISVLADEQFGDCSDDAFVTAIRKGKLKPEQIYKAMSALRYVWRPGRGYWVWKPRHMRIVTRILAIANKFESFDTEK
jgi:hypothetical protein